MKQISVPPSGACALCRCIELSHFSTASWLGSDGTAVITEVTISATAPHSGHHARRTVRARTMSNEFVSIVMVVRLAMLFLPSEARLLLKRIQAGGDQVEMS